MCETPSPWSMKDYRTELLRQDNSALRAKVAAQEKELSLLRGKIIISSSIVTALRVDLGALQAHLGLTVVELLHPRQGVSLAGTTLERVNHCQQTLEKSWRSCIQLGQHLYLGGNLVGAKKKNVWSSLCSIFKAKPKEVC